MFGCGNSNKPATTDRQNEARKAEQDNSADAQRRRRQIDADKSNPSHAREWQTSQEHTAPEF
jgi:hypothetical protein